MSVSEDQIAFALELFEGLGPLTTRKMMGGLCLYSDGQIFAILGSSGMIYIKAKDALAEAMATKGATQFGADGDRQMGYWTLPEDALDDQEIACDWARRSLASQN